MAYKLDIHATCRAIDRKDYGYLERQSEEARNAFAPLVVMRWASVAADSGAADLMLVQVNEMANQHFFDLSDHSELQYKLLAAAGLGQSLRHEWLAGPKPKRAGNKLYAFLAKYWPDANDMELEILLKQFDRKSFRQFVETSGIDPKDIRGLMDAYTRYEKEESGES
jgi:hypothetical protein